MIDLFSPLKLREIELKNRIAVSPMCQYSSQDGFANDWHMVHLGSRAVGGAALIMTEATSVSPEGRISIDDLGIWKDDHIAGLKRITDFILQQNAIPGIQLAHAGRKSSRTSAWKGDRLLSASEGGWETVAPSAIPFSDDTSVPIALTHEGIGKVISDFRLAAVRSLKAGFRVAEIHAAHGYLIHEFMSPLTNKRPDDYGGSFENRIRILLEVVEAVRSTWPDGYPLFVRITSCDWREDGWTLDDSVKLAAILKEKGVDLLDCSSGGAVPGLNIPAGPGYQVQFAEQIRKKTGIPTGAVGIITTPEQAQAIISSGQADIVSLAREFLRDPYFPLHAAAELGAEIPWPSQYERARRRK
ncbi:MAG: NADH:flavin oxidoreductase/NADH oxidase [Bacteroidetes bacterium]|nr:NADH:flavin oxidoreductase/NADH oxidase [Bacteroidota bacterium]